MKKFFYSMTIALILATIITTTAFAGTTISPKILAGQNTFVGVAKITGNADGSLTIVLMVTGGAGYCVTDAAVHVGLSLSDFPTNNGGAIPGQFDYQYDFGGCTAHPPTITIQDPPGMKGDIYLSIHVNVYGPNGVQETGWIVRCGNLEGAQFPGNNWSAWIFFPSSAWF